MIIALTRCPQIEDGYIEAVLNIKFNENNQTELNYDLKGSIRKAKLNILKWAKRNIKKPIGVKKKGGYKKLTRIPHKKNSIKKINLFYFCYLKRFNSSS